MHAYRFSGTNTEYDGLYTPVPFYYTLWQGQTNDWIWVSQEKTPAGVRIYANENKKFLYRTQESGQPMFWVIYDWVDTMNTSLVYIYPTSSVDTQPPTGTYSHIDNSGSGTMTSEHWSTAQYEGYLASGAGASHYNGVFIRQQVGDYAPLDGFGNIPYWYLHDDALSLYLGTNPDNHWMMYGDGVTQYDHEGETPAGEYTVHIGSGPSPTVTAYTPTTTVNSRGLNTEWTGGMTTVYDAVQLHGSSGLALGARGHITVSATEAVQLHGAAGLSIGSSGNVSIVSTSQSIPPSKSHVQWSWVRVKVGA